MQLAKAEGELWWKVVGRLFDALLEKQSSFVRPGLAVNGLTALQQGGQESAVRSA